MTMHGSGIAKMQARYTSLSQTKDKAKNKQYQKGKDKTCCSGKQKSEREVRRGAAISKTGAFD